MSLAIALTSIIIITGLIWLLNKILPRPLCPVCAGVGGTWFWLIVAAKFFSYEIDPMIPALLLGGSVVGITYQIEKRITGKQLFIFWKTAFIAIGFAGAYSLLKNQWYIFLTTATAFLIIALIVLMLPALRSADKQKVKKLTKEMENCC